MEPYRISEFIRTNSDADFRVIKLYIQMHINQILSVATKGEGPNFEYQERIWKAAKQTVHAIDRSKTTQGPLHAPPPGPAPVQHFNQYPPQVFGQGQPYQQYRQTQRQAPPGPRLKRPFNGNRDGTCHARTGQRARNAHSSTARLTTTVFHPPHSHTALSPPGTFRPIGAPYS